MSVGLRTGWGFTAIALVALCLAACSGPIVARSPEALYAQAREQAAHANYTPAVDTLARVAREATDTEMIGRAEVLRLALLIAMARTNSQVAESYLAGHEKARGTDFGPKMHSIAADYFGRTRSRTIEIVEALDRLQQKPPAGTLPVDTTAAVTPQGDPALLDQLRDGRWVDDEKIREVEKGIVQRELADMLKTFARTEAPASGSEPLIEPAGLYLAVAKEVVDLAPALRPEALGDPRMQRLFYERAASAAGRAAELGRQQGQDQIVRESEQLQVECQKALAKK